LPDPAAVAEATGQRLVAFLLSAQSVRAPTHVALTGGTLGAAVLARVRANPLLGAISWPDVHLWWGDERFVPAGSDQRNEVQARRALLDHLPEAPGGVHPIAGSDRGLSLSQAADSYTAELRRWEVTFDLVLSGVGPDGHVASVFPAMDGPAGQDPPAAFAVRGAPKPPPDRVSLSLTTINAAREVWLFAAGEPKRQAVTQALAAGAGGAGAAGAPGGAGTGGVSAGADLGVPAARVSGRERTLWLIDLAAAPLPA
jgi:6-phosphogluconolactonase